MPIDPNLYTFVKSQMAAGRSREEISIMLITKGGWSQQDVDLIFAEVGETSIRSKAPSQIPPPQMPPSIQASSGIVARPAPTPTFSGGPVVPSIDNPKKGKKWSTIIIVIVLLVIIGAGGVAAYYFGVPIPFLPSLSTRPAPTVVLADSIRAMSDITSLAYSGSSQLNVNVVSTSTIAGNAAISVSATSTGALDSSSPTFPALDDHLQLGVSGTAFSGTTTYSGNAALDFEMKLLKQDNAEAIYFVLNTLSFNATSSPVNPGVAIAEMFADGMVGRVKGQWIYATGTPETVDPSLNQNDIASKKQALLDKLATFDYVNSISELPDATISGMPTYHYALIIDLNKLFSEIRSVAGTSTPAVQIPQQQLPPLSVEVWIGKSDSYVYQMHIPSQNFDISGGGSKNMITIESTVTMSNFNKPVSIAVPAGAITFQQLLTNLGLNLFQPVESATSTASKPVKSPVKIKTK